MAIRAPSSGSVLKNLHLARRDLTNRDLTNKAKATGDYADTARSVFRKTRQGTLKRRRWAVRKYVLAQAEKHQQLMKSED
jgi:hypothetical protein